MRPIDADTTLDLLKSLGNREHRRTKGTIAEAEKMLANEEYTPTLDVQPVRHGHWNEKTDCSVCGMPAPTDDRIDFINIVELNFCPYCGAKMDEEAEA